MPIRAQFDPDMQIIVIACDVGFDVCMWTTLYVSICVQVELERKVVSLSKSKQHYKEQWSKALSELAVSRQRDQAAARNQLQTQQQELEAMRVQYFQQEQQNSLKLQLSQIKKDVNTYVCLEREAFPP